MFQSSLTEKQGQMSKEAVIWFQNTLHHCLLQDAKNKFSHASATVFQLH